MKKEHIGKKGALVISLVIVVTIVQLISTTVFSIVIDKFFSKEKSFPCPSYCKEISKQISDLDLKGFKYTEAEEERKEGIYFRFKSGGNYDELYDDDDCLNDIVKIKNVISAYLSSHKNEILHEKTIRLLFCGEIGNVIQIYNYEKSGSTPEEEFAYYDDMYISPEYFADFTEAKRIGISITDNDDLSGLANFTDLKELKIYIENEVSQNTINKIVEILPDCEVTYRSKKYGRIRKK